MTFRLGLTGSIGMGKSTTARMFAEEGIPVWSADDAVHRLYAPGGAAVPALAALCPAAVTAEGVSRGALARAALADPGLLDRVEAVVHPLVAADRETFLAGTDAPVAVLDIPLLFERGLEALCDGIAVVSAPEAVQRARVLSRPGMTPDKFRMILARQLPDAEKRARADWVIPTTSPDEARAAVRSILDDIRRRFRDA